jgi:hypothetical protein
VNQFIDSYKFSDVVRLWARERLVHEVIVGRELARGVVAEGLRVESANPKWLKTSESFRGYPYIGFSAIANAAPIVIRAAALEHLLTVARGATDPVMSLLCEEFVTRDAFKTWLLQTRRTLPLFWFASEDTHNAA